MRIIFSWKTQLFRAVVFVTTALLFLGYAGFGLYQQWLSGAFLPSWTVWENAEIAADLDNDGAFEAVSLRNRNLTVYDNGAYADALPQDWYVSRAFVQDIDYDGIQEIICLTWKRGSYGVSKPFWVERDDWNFSQHVFIFQYRDGEIKHHWLSSDVRMKIANADVDPRGCIHLYLADGTEEVCQWQEWGLAFIDEKLAAEYDDRTVMELVVAGDNIIHEGTLQEARNAAAAAGRDGYDFSEVYRAIAPEVRAANIATVNQEGPLAADENAVSGMFPRFASPVAVADALSDAGFDVIALANNHIGDRGAAGIEETLAYWGSRHPGSTVVGANSNSSQQGNPAFVTYGAMTLAFVNYTFALNDGVPLDECDAWRVNSLQCKAEDVYVAGTPHEERFLESVAQARAQSDVVVCLLHAGKEYAKEPSEGEKQLIERAIDAGATMVVCTHPHVVQRAERVVTPSGNQAYVCYSLGNLVSNQVDPRTALGAMARIIVQKPFIEAGDRQGGETKQTPVVSFQLIPTVCQYGQGQTMVYWLSDYTDHLAQKHYLNAIEPGSMSLQGLQKQWIQIFDGK